MTHSQEREQRKLAYYVEPQNGVLKRKVRHILGKHGGKDSATLLNGYPSVTRRCFPFIDLYSWVPCVFFATIM